MSLPRLLLLCLTLACAAPAAAQDSSQVPTVWRLLDYIAVDYSGAVSGGKIVNAAEYAEMREFSASVHNKLEALPQNAAKPQLIAADQRLRAAIDSKAAPARVAELARALASDLLRAYPVALGPAKAPNLARATNLYRQNCASCHGAEGDANTAMARQLDPPPIAFTNRARAAERSPFALYQVIDQGLEGTAMASFSNLPAEDKWALAFHTGSLAYPQALAREGQRIWASDPDVRAVVPNLDALSGLSEQALAVRIGADRAGPVIAYLRAHPETLAAKAGSLALARDKLGQSLAAYEAGDREGARALALSAYLDGFEPIEPALGAKDGALLAEVERAMAQLRSAIAAGRPVPEVRDRIAAIDTLFARAEAAIAADDQSAVSAFVGALAILLREGLEALLIVIGMLAFLRKADRREMERPVHYGWASALVAGGLTWWAATSLITVSGASREVTEGFGSLLAAAVLLFVGIWMHGKAQAGQWQRYIRGKMSHALTGRSAWFLFGLAFIAVYREVFETILFYAAMAAQGHVDALVAGGLTGALLLAVIAVAMLRFSQRLPIGKFFAYSSALVAVLAVVLAGKGVAALQEAGYLGIRPLDWAPRISMLGLFPSVQTITAQIAALVILLLGFAWNRRTPAEART
ncbi:MAG TPA: FTR1 family protein [Sphingomicrobium sp.]|nr:FTR1 family protein [Sphingomicrobium sp.]